MDRAIKLLKIKRLFLCLGCWVAVVFSLCAQSAWAAFDSNRTAQGISHYIMGLMHDWEGMPQEAVQEYEKAANADQDSYAIHLRLGTDYARLGKIKEAVEELQIATKLNPDDMQTHYILALIYSDQQDFDKAAGEYELILKHLSKSDPQNIEVYSYLGQLYYSQKKFDKALEEFRHILKLEPSNADVIFTLGSIHLELNERKKAVEYFKKALDINPKHGNSLNSLAYMYAEDGTNLDEAVELVKKALDVDPNNGAYLDSLGWVYFKKGKYQEALDLLMKANNLYKDPVIYEHLGDVYYKMAQNENAEKYWKQSLELQPGQKNVQEKLEALKKGEVVIK